MEPNPTNDHKPGFTSIVLLWLNINNSLIIYDSPSKFSLYVYSAVSAILPYPIKKQLIFSKSNRDSYAYYTNYYVLQSKHCKNTVLTVLKTKFVYS
jgi:hypothetical protein